MCFTNRAPSVHFSDMDARITITDRNVITKSLLLCFKGKSSSLKEALEYIFLCEIYYIKHCTDTPFRPNISFKYQRLPYCGNIHIRPGASINTKLSIKVIEKHILKFNFIIFNFHRTFKVCGPDTLHLTDHVLNTTSVYCGSRMPWTMVSAGEWCDITINVSSNLSSTMKLFYQAKHRRDIRRVSASDWLHLRGPITNVFIAKTVSHSILFTALPHQTVLTQVSWIDYTATDNVLVFDGPGKYSPVILHLKQESPTSVYSATSSAFNAYIMISHQINTYNSTNFHLEATVTRMRVCNSTYSQKTDFLSEHSFHTKRNSVCMFHYSLRPGIITAFPLIHFINFIFIGPDTIQTVHTDGCDYGGIFIDVDKNVSYIDRAVCKSSKDFVMYVDLLYLKLFVIWFQGYSSGSFKGRVQYRNCPTSYISAHTQLTYFTEKCHYYVCQADKCVVRLQKYNTSFGPIVLKIAKAEDLEILPLRIKLPFICRSEVRVQSVWSKQWIIDKTAQTTHKRISAFWRSYKHNYIYTKEYDFLHNCTSYIKTCYQSPIGIALTVQQCNTFIVPETRPITSGGILNLYHVCKITKSKEVTWYILEPKNVDIILQIKSYFRCTDRCTKTTIIIHESIPDQQMVYRYVYAFSGEFTWHAHKNQGGFSVTILPEENCRPREICVFTITTQLTQPTPDTYEHSRYDYQLLPQG